MARPVTDTPRLAAIVPDHLAAAVAGGAVEHLHHLLLALSLGQPYTLPEPEALLDLRHTVAALASYARAGGRLDASVSEYLLSLLPLWQYAAHSGGGVETPEFDAALAGDLDSLDDDWRGQLVVVMVAALGREVIAQGEPATVAHLAALASLSPDHVRLLARRGEIALAGGEHLSGAHLSASASEARRWLGGRGVEV